MSNLRFALLASALFAIAFAGVFWGSKVFPVASMRAPAHAPEMAAATPAPQAQIVDVAKPEAKPEELQPDPKPAVLKEPGPTRPAQAPADSGRDQIRLTAIQAANAYTLTPCDRAVKAAFIVATATYIKSMSSTTGDGAVATATDTRVRTAVEAALRIGGVRNDEFPAGIPLWSTAVARSASGPAPCGSGRRAETVRR